MAKELRKITTLFVHKLYKERERETLGSFGKDMEINSSHSNSMLGHSN